MSQKILSNDQILLFYAKVIKLLDIQDIILKKFYNEFFLHFHSTF